MSQPTKTVVITPNQSFNSGNARLLLSQLNCGPIVEQKNGNLEARLTDDQIAMFRLKGPMHQIKVTEPVSGDMSIAALGDEVLAWRTAAECDTPEELSANLNQMVDSFRNELNECEETSASLSETVSSWKLVTGVATPEAFGAGFEAKPKAK
jgi:hypothetical protein